MSAVRKATDDAFPIPELALEQHQAILGKTGSGKTSTAKLIIEHVVAEDYRVCVLDPIKSDWWGVTSSADGKRPGLPFTILGGGGVILGARGLAREQQQRRPFSEAVPTWT